MTPIQLSAERLKRKY
ncbi:hypothetical protein, partial [Rhodoblastus sp.]